MRFTCTQENLSEGLSVVSHIASKSTNLPILNNILIHAEKGGIRLLATNLEIAITKNIRGKVEEEGQTTLPAKIFSEYIALLTEQTVSLSLDGTTVVITGGDAETRLRSLPADDFPLIPNIEKKGTFTCDARALESAISKTLFAAASDDTRPEISGVYLHCANNTLTLAATDSYRLAETSITLLSGESEEQSAIVPVRTLQEALRVLHDGPEQAHFSFTQNQFVLTYDESELISRLIDGQYPDYKQIIPTHEETRVLLDVDELLRAVRSTSLFSRPGINDIVLTIDPEAQSLTLNAANSQVGEHRRTLGAEITGEKNTIVFNSRYLLDGLLNIGAPQAIFTLTNSTNPGVFRPNNEQQTSLYIIMPIKQ